MVRLEGKDGQGAYIIAEQVTAIYPSVSEGCAAVERGNSPVLTVRGTPDEVWEKLRSALEGPMGG